MESTQELDDQRVADQIFDALGIYERDQLAVFGTAFTTYEEDYNENVCAWLNARARSWKCAMLTRSGS